MEEFLNLDQLSKVLAELEEPKCRPLNDWGDLSNVLTEIKDNLSYTEKLKEILRWIGLHPRHTYPKKIKGWVNVLCAQFCPAGSDIKAEELVDHMVSLGILNVVEYSRQVRRQIIVTNRVRIDHKRCSSDVIDEEFPAKRHKLQ